MEVTPATYHEAGWVKGDEVHVFRAVEEPLTSRAAVRSASRDGKTPTSNASRRHAKKIRSSTAAACS